MSRLAALLSKKAAASAPVASAGTKSAKKRKQRGECDDLEPARRAPRTVPAGAGDDSGQEDGLDDVPAAYDELVGLLSRQSNSLASGSRRRAHNGAAGGSEDEGLDEEGAAAAHRSREQRKQKQKPAADQSKQQQQKNQQELSKKEAANGEAAAAVDEEEEAAAAAAAADEETAAPAADPWVTHLTRELTESEAAALRSNDGQTSKFVDPAPSAADAAYTGLWPRAKWQVAGREGLPAAAGTLAAAGVKERLRTRWSEVHEEDSKRGGASSRSGRSGDFASGRQRALFGLVNSYSDVLHACKPYPVDATAPDEDLDAVLLHCLNHVAKSADLVKRNNDRLKAAAGAAAGPSGSSRGENAAAAGGENGCENGGENGGGSTGGVGVVEGPPRDQGFTRPKVLLLLPMRNLAYRAVKRLVALALRETRADSVQGKERFLEQFAGDEGAEDEEGPKASWARKPPEHRALFGGDTDDHFRMGIKITRGAIRLFSDLLSSDIIVASPLAISTKLAEERAAAAAAASGGKKGGPPGAGGKKGAGNGPPAAGKRSQTGPGGRSDAGVAESDFLSSIEVLVVERADVMAMQNFDHVVTVLDALNKLPQQQHGTDIMRVRDWYLTGRAALYRQTIVTSSFASPDIFGIFSKRCCSHAGKARLVAEPAGVLSQVVPKLRQTFERFEAPSAAAAAEARLSHFRAAVWPRLQEACAAGGVLLFIPQYFDFVRVRNFLKSEEADFMALSEYTEYGQATRARSLFQQRRTPLLLYTERAHFYHRYRIKGINDVVFYGIPEHAHFYSELLNMAAPTSSSSAADPDAATAPAGQRGAVTALFCRYDALALGRVVGAARARKMLGAESGTFLFVSQ